MAKAKKSKRTSGGSKPKQASVTMYNVGFGDCFLVTFSYSNGEDRRVLIDCGSSSERKTHMGRVVGQIIKDSRGHVDAVVVTHRHKDHLSAFGLKGLGAKLASLKPEVVIQPWTEHPDAGNGGKEAPSVFTLAATKHMTALGAAQGFAEMLAEHGDKLLAAAPKRVREQLRKIASLSIPNKAAVKRLAGMGKRRAYVHAGGPSGLERLLPGVNVTVLGPPTLKQSGGTTRRQTSWDDDEFWKLQARIASEETRAQSVATKSALFPKAKTMGLSRAPSYVGWAIRKLDSARIHGVRRIVRILDDALNNTSVVLLFEYGNKALLFPGDAQLETWEYALADSAVGSRLRNTTVYKVGHHGSTNATPRSLWNLFTRRGKPGLGRLVSLLSTQHGHHNRVPRKSLVCALQKDTVMHCTENWRGELGQTYDF